MSDVKKRRARENSYFSRFRGVVSALFAVAFIGTVSIVPLWPSANALGDESYEQFSERIHQQFVPEDVADPVIDLSVSEPEKLPEPVREVVPAAPVEPSAPAAVAPLPQYSGGGSPAEWMAAAGIPESEWAYVDYIVTRESTWNPNATNPSSGACGLVQALPCSKVPGNGYDPVDNLRWASGYANGRYGSWKQAYEFWINNHWW